MTTFEDAKSNFRYEEFRPHQLNVLCKIAEALDSGTDAILLNAPTGFGKTVVLDAIASTFKDAFYVVTLKSLEEQVEREFKDYAKVHGRNNYDCIRNPIAKCDVGICQLLEYKCRKECKQEKCTKDAECPYELAKNKAKDAHTALANIWYYYKSNVDGDMFGKRDILILDEAHLLPELLVNFNTIELSESLLNPNKYRKGFNRINFNLWDEVSHKYIDAFNNNTLNDLVEDYLDLLGEELIPLRDSKPWLVEQAGVVESYDINTNLFKWFKQLENTADKLDSIKNDEFVVDQIENTFYNVKEEAIRFTPLYSKIAARKLFETGKKVILSSGTLNHELMRKELGMDGYFENIIEINVPSTFPVYNRVVNLLRVAQFTKRNQNEVTEGLLRDAINTILNLHIGQRGIIFFSAYKYVKIVKSLSSRLVFHDKETRNSSFEDWVEDSRIDSVFCGVNFDEGIDLLDGLARFGIIVKCPFADVSNPRINERVVNRGEREWYSKIAAQKMVQACGRIVRSPEDYGIMYVLDSSGCALLNSYAPDWMKEALCWTTLSEIRNIK